MQSQMLSPQKMVWVSELSLLLAFVTLMLWLMWFREHKLKDQAIEDLHKEGIRFPVTHMWTGVVDYAWVVLPFWLFVLGRYRSNWVYKSPMALISIRPITRRSARMRVWPQ